MWTVLLKNCIIICKQDVHAMEICLIEKKTTYIKAKRMTLSSHKAKLISPYFFKYQNTHPWLSIKNKTYTKHIPLSFHKTKRIPMFFSLKTRNTCICAFTNTNIKNKDANQKKKTTNITKTIEKTKTKTKTNTHTTKNIWQNTISNNHRSNKDQ